MKKQIKYFLTIINFSFVFLGIISLWGILMYNFFGENVKHSYMRVLSKKSLIEYNNFYRSFDSVDDNEVVAEARIPIRMRDLQDGEIIGDITGELYLQGEMYNLKLNSDNLELEISKDVLPWKWNFLSWFGVGFGDNDFYQLEDLVVDNEYIKVASSSPLIK